MPSCICDIRDGSHLTNLSVESVMCVNKTLTPGVDQAVSVINRSGDLRAVGPQDGMVQQREYH